jgi:flagellar hook-associated protein 2
MELHIWTRPDGSPSPSEEFDLTLQAMAASSLERLRERSILQLLKKNIQTFLDTYNTLNSTLSSAMKYSTETKTSAALQGDSTAVGVQSALRSLFRTEISGWKYQRVSDIGITLQSDGSMGLVA